MHGACHVGPELLRRLRLGEGRKEGQAVRNEIRGHWVGVWERGRGKRGRGGVGTGLREGPHRSRLEKCAGAIAPTRRVREEKRREKRGERKEGIGERGWGGASAAQMHMRRW